jgi:hypothetical protein
MIRFDVKVDPASFSDIAINSMRSLVNEALNMAAKESVASCRIAFRNSLRRQREHDSLFGSRSSFNNNPLKSAFGLTDALAISAVDAIMDMAQSMLKITILNASDGKRGPNQPLSSFGGLRIVLVPEDISPLYNVSGASYISATKGGSHTIDWLQWLLERGQQVIISDYYPIYQAELSAASRSRDALMVPSGDSGRRFAVSATYAGRRGNNWITRAANSCLPQIQNILQQAIIRNLK